MPDPITHKTLDLYARIGETEHTIGQARVPVHATFDPKAENLREGLTFTVGDPIVTGLEGYGEKAVKADKALKKWRQELEAELNTPAGTDNTTPSSNDTSSPGNNK